MIYLFNSSFKPTYLENLYRLVGFPEHTRVDIRYTAGINAPDVGSTSYMHNSKCIICYVDRFNGQYIYYPCRKGIIRGIKPRHSRVYYTVELTGHCHSEAPRDFTNKIQDSVPDSPRLTGGDPKCKKDGVYCVDGPEPGPLIKSTDESWSKIVDQIYKTQAFSDGMPALFLAEIERDGKKPSGKEYGLEFYANTDYEITIHYKFPFNENAAEDRSIQIKMGSEIDRELKVGSAEDQLLVRFNLPPLGFSAGEIIIKTILDKRVKNLKGASYSYRVPFRAYSWRTNLILVGVLLLVSFLAEFHQVGGDLANTRAWFSTILEAAKSVFLIWVLFIYRGKLNLPGH